MMALRRNKTKSLSETMVTYLMTQIESLDLIQLTSLGHCLNEKTNTRKYHIIVKTSNF